MTTKTPADKQSENYEKALAKLSVFLTKHIYKILFLILLITFIDPSFFTLRFSDSDGYMRAVRVHNWLKNPSFFEHPLPQSNFPFGEISHWTRPMDILWLICSLPFFLFMPIKQALFTGGHLLSPLFLLLSVFTLAYGLKRWFNIWLVLIGCFIFLTNQEFHVFYAPNYPDHHSLMMFLSLSAAMQTLCWYKTRQNKYLTRIGVILALATMVAIEGIFLFIVFLFPFILHYLFKPNSLAPSRRVLNVFTLGLSFFWLLNPPYEGWFYPDNGRISFLYVCLCWFCAIGYAVLNKHTPKNVLTKILSLAAIGLGALTLSFFIFGTNIFVSPIDAKLNQIWANRISEMQSFWLFPSIKQIKYYAFAITALLLNICLIKNRPYRKILLLNFCWGVPLFSLSLFAIRFTAYQVVFTIIPYLVLIARIYQSSAFYQDKSKDFPISVWISVIAIFLFEISISIPYCLAKKNDNKAVEISNKELRKNIRDIGGTIVTDVFLSSQYIWESDVNTVGTAYHRNHMGLIDNHNILYAENDKTLYTLLKKHKVTQILLFAAYDSTYYPIKDKHKNKLYYRLITRQNLPSFVEEIPSSSEQSRHYKIKYSVDFPLSFLENHRYRAIIN